MNYKNELKKMDKHRKRFYPAMSRLMEMYNNPNDIIFPVEILDKNDMLILLELLDIGYLDEDAMIVKKRFNDISNLYYNGDYPLTENGDYFFKNNAPNRLIKVIEKIFKKQYKERT